jgi:hypothetical protein
MGIPEGSPKNKDLSAVTSGSQKREANWGVKKSENQAIPAANTPDEGSPAVGEGKPTAGRPGRQRVFVSGTSDCFSFNELYERWMKSRGDWRRQIPDKEDSQKDTQ